MRSGEVKVIRVFIEREKEIERERGKQREMVRSSVFRERERERVGGLIW